MHDVFDSSPGFAWLDPFAAEFSLDPFPGYPVLKDQAAAATISLWSPDIEIDVLDLEDTPEPQEAASGKTVSDAPVRAFGEDDVTDVGGITITAERGMSLDEIDEILNDLYGGGGGDPGQQTGGGSDQTQEERPYDPCEDRQADTLADQIKDEIMAKGDSDRVEYHSLIWRDDQGNLHMTDPLPLTDTFPADPAALGLDSYSQVVGLVHSHPTEVNIGTEAAPNWADASHGWIWGGDWRDAQWWVDNHDLDENNFTMYIVYDGQVREYDWRDNKDRNVFNDVTDEDAVESGDYNPGASCS